MPCLGRYPLDLGNWGRGEVRLCRHAHVENPQHRAVIISSQMTVSLDKQAVGQKCLPANCIGCRFIGCLLQCGHHLKKMIHRKRDQCYCEIMAFTGVDCLIALLSRLFQIKMQHTTRPSAIGMLDPIVDL